MERLAAWFTWIKEGLVESFFRYKASTIPYRKTLGFLLGFIAALLLLTSWTDSGAKPIAEGTAALIFAVLVGLIFVLLVIVRPNDEGALDRFTWGVLVIIVLGFGTGALAFHYRENVVWLWHQSRNIDSSPRVILAALFLLGVILGFFVVRNWAKEQKDFVASLTAVFGGAFVASIVGKLDGGPPLIDSFAAYALGFTLSGTINLIVAARLTASYTNRRTIASRAMLDFLYGSERATIIDGYFLKNFNDDKDYAKAWLTEALIELSAFARRRFAERMERRRQVREAGPAGWHCYRLVAVESEVEMDPPPALEADRPHEILYRRVNVVGITEEMFRVSVSVKWQDVLEYIVAPGEYKGTFPLLGSVSGLALLVRQTIVMPRDRFKNFRSKDYGKGITPDKISQQRGLDEIDFLSYISIPIVSRRGRSTENPVGILAMDTRLFLANDAELAGNQEREPGTYSLPLTGRTLAVFANRLYEQNDEDIEYLEQITKIIVPVLELYLKCRIGAT